MYGKLPLCLCLIALLSSCLPDEDEFTPADGPRGSFSAAAFAGFYDEVPTPADNPSTYERVELGRLLFWDPILSGDRDIACATCHHPDNDYAELRQLSAGVGGVGLSQRRIGGALVTRNSMAIVNAALNGWTEDGPSDPTRAVMFWDNREHGLEAQALGPIRSQEEMCGERIHPDNIVDTVVQRLQALPQYLDRFQDAFGSREITAERMGMALAAFERSLVARNSPFDRYQQGDAAALTNLQIEGLLEFRDSGCDNCHSGPMFSDYELHVLGVPDVRGLTDRGAEDRFAFRTPTLRNLTATAPYMHNGRFASLRDVVEFYEELSDRRRGGAANSQVPFNQIADEARDLNLGRGDINAIVAFLESLSDPGLDRVVPASVPSGLTVGGNIE